MRLRLLLLAFVLVPGFAQAATYIITDNASSLPPCSSNDWSRSGNTWTCGSNGTVMLNNGDKIESASTYTIKVNAGITLNGTVTVGTPSVSVHLETTYGPLTVNIGSTVYVYGDLKTGSGLVKLENTFVTGAITTDGTVELSGGSVSGSVSGRNGVTANATEIGGDVTSTNGTVYMTGSSVSGSVFSSGGNGVHLENTTVGGNVTGQNETVYMVGGSVGGAIHSSGGDGVLLNGTSVTGGGITTTTVAIVITNSTHIAGPISTQGGPGITIDNSIVVSGPITSPQPITITNNSIVGSPTSPVEVISGNRLWVRNNSKVYGHVEGAEWQKWDWIDKPNPEHMVDDTSWVHGDCANGTLNSGDEPEKYNLRCDGDPTGGTGPGLHHIRIEHAGGGVTCAPTTLVIKACANADCQTLFTGGVSGELTKSGTPTVNWIGGSGFTIDSSGETTKQVHVTTPGVVTWGTDASVTHCYVGATESCAFVAAQAAFFVDVPNHAAGTMQPITVSAVRASDNAQVCVPAFSNVSKTVNFSCAYSNPASGTLPLVVGGNAVSCPASTGVSLSFNDNGVASTTVSYADVGQMSLTASYSGTGDEAGLVMTGTDSFIVAPHSFAVTTTGPYVAGVPFTVMVTAKNAQGNTTPNFGKENPPEGVALAHTLVAPVNGNDPPLTGTPLVSGASFSAGGWTGTDSLSWGEVGDISVTATLSNADGYLGSGLTANGSGNAGPFRPHHFITEVTPGTGTFTYSGQPFTVKVTARNTNNLTTQNYQGSYAKAVTLSDGNSATNNSATLGSFTNAQVPAAAFILGEGEVDDIVYTFSDKQTAPLEAANVLKLRATDADGVTSAGATEGETPIRAGRLRLINYHGSERLAPRVEYRLEYWDGNRWTANDSDTVTLIAPGNVAITGGLTVSSILPNTGGGGFIVFNTAAQGSYDIAVNLNTSGSDTSCNTSHGGAPASLPWLQGFWAAEDSCGGTLPWKQDPNARIRLGSPKAPYIYLRERY